VRAVLVALLIGTAALAAGSSGAHADEVWRKSTSLIGTPKYPDDFKHYDYVNPDAPKGGTLHQAVNGTFDSLNPYIVTGTPAAGLAGFGGGMLYDTLMEQSTDQSSTAYGLIAEALSFPADFSWVKFRLNPAAHWHDGTPITADDVVWSFQAVKAQSPLYNKYYNDVAKAEITGEREVIFTFAHPGNRELPSIMGDLVVLPKHWWEGTDASGKKRDISKTTLEPPLGSGPYKIETASPGRSIAWSRVVDYWGKDLPVRVGRNNFDRIQYDYYRDQNSVWEAFKKGGLADYRQENRIGRWVQEYNFPAVTRKDVIQQSFPYHAIGRMQGYVLNERKPKFQDIRVRQALTYAFDFETLNRTLFFSRYKRINSYFAGIDLASTGIPQGEELDILNGVKDLVPPELFTQPFILPAYETPQAGRDNLRKALALLQEAGWVLKGPKLVNAKTGEPFTIEFLQTDPSYEKIDSPFIQNLKRIGIDASLRVIDSSQYQERVNNFDFDVVWDVISQTQSPGNEQRDMWGSASAAIPGSRNLSGIKNPAVDKLIDRIIFSKDRDDLIAASHALDRVLLWNYFMIPHWYSDTINIAYWNKFGIPAKQPDYVGVDTDSWWIDPALEKKLGTSP
jgi:microcin C transport system substrate-binding protein